MSNVGMRRAPIARRHLAIVAAAALCLALWRVLAGDPLTDAIENRLLDLRFQVRGPVSAPESVVVVAIDEASIDRLGWVPPPRAAIAAAIRRILDAGPGVLAVDLLFLDETEDDPALAEVLASSEGVVLGAAIENRPASAEAPLQAALSVALQRSAIPVVLGEPEMRGPGPRLLLPRPALLGAASLAHVNIARSPDRMARRMPLALWVGDAGFLPSLSLEVARRLAGLGRGEVVLRPDGGILFGGRAIAAGDRAGRLTLNHYGGPGRIPTVSLIDVLDGRIGGEVFAGRGVIIGATAESLSDLYATPYSPEVSGVEILATAAANLVGGEPVRREGWGGALGLGLALALAVLIFVAANIPSPAAAIAVAVFAWATGAALVQIAFAAGALWLDATAVFAALLFASTWCTLQRLRADWRLSKRLSSESANLSRYLSPFLAEELARNAVPAFDRRSQDAAVVFVDVTGFTTLTEGRDPASAAVFLHELHRLYERVASAHRGVISSFEGDGAMIVFGLPEPRPDDAAAALECGRALLDAANRFTSSAFPEHRLELRVSVHHGPVTAAVVGGERHAQITITGDTVNVASRLQEIARARGVAFVVSRACLDAARDADGTAAAGFVRLADEPIRGRGGRIEVWSPG
jgi:adenylate cyclase